MDIPVDTDNVFKEMNIGSINGAEQEATNDLVENAVLNEYVKR